MSLVEKVIESAGKFEGDLEAQREAYVRATHNVPDIETEIGLLKGALKASTGFTKLNLPPEEGIVVEPIKRGPVTFNIKVERRKKKPSYKWPCEAIERYLEGILTLLSQGRTITQIRKENGEFYAPVQFLKDSFDAIVAPYFLEEPRFVIDYVVEGSLATEGVLERLVLPAGRDPTAFDEANFVRFVRLSRILENDLAFIADYEAGLAKRKTPEKKEDVVQVGEKAYKALQIRRMKPDYANVVKTLITVPIKRARIGEFEVLADPNVTIDEKREMFPYYELIEREAWGQPTLYVSLRSVQRRIWELKAPAPYQDFVVWDPWEIK
ncbi:hypothetical protein D6745_05080 [Candidatus Woesearchaeota archaeon]|nr:MAG: hypothetical protein D6745_05080 [Candidatus Woesearchaeota archaeon]